MKRAMHLKKASKGYIGGFGERGKGRKNGIIKLHYNMVKNISKM